MEKQHPLFHPGDSSVASLPGISQSYLFSSHCPGSGLLALLQAEDRAVSLEVPTLEQLCPCPQGTVLPSQISPPTSFASEPVPGARCPPPLPSPSGWDLTPESSSHFGSLHSEVSPPFPPAAPSTSPPRHSSSLPHLPSIAPTLTQCLLPTVRQVHPLRV